MKARWTVLIILLFAVVLSQFSFSQRPDPIEMVRAKYLADLAAFRDQGRYFKKVLEDGASSSDLKRAFEDLRRNFKRVEFLLDYLQNQDVKDHINGAPLPKTERNAPRLVIIEPKGLQRMEELVYADSLDAAQLQKLSTEFNYQLEQINRFAQKMPFDDRQVFEAMRLGLVRIMSMGLSGFDTPASERAIYESAVAWEAIGDCAALYGLLLEDKALKLKIEAEFQAGLDALRAKPDFTQFDRASFIRNYLHPLYADLLELHQKLHYETLDEVYQGVLAFDYNSPEVFSEQFFNLEYFTGLNQEAPEFEAQKELGKRLFFDPILSRDLNRSCATCHKPELAFSDGLPKSEALNGGFLQRNSPGLFNALYAERFFYDLRADRMESQMEHVIFSPEEFGSSYKLIFNRLDSSKAYKSLFKAAFPKLGGGADRYKLSRAIMAYMSDLKAFDTKIDRYLRGERTALSPEEHQGFNLFMGKAACATCHFLPSFSGLVPPFFEENESEVLGVFTAPQSGVLDPDLGRFAGGVVQDEAPFFRHSFKTPSLRNVAFTAPYFHNGAFPDLRSVLEFYNHGGAQGFGLAISHQTLPPDSLGLDEGELQALESFLEALSDTSALMHH